MNIDFSINDGSPTGVVYPDLYGENGRIGVGGAEQALLTICEGFVRAGHGVRVYNSPTHVGVSPFPQFPIDTFIPKEERDVVIAFRSPNHRLNKATGKKIWWSCDQFTVGDFKDFATKVDKIVTISPFHSKYFESTYEITNTTVIDLPVRIQDYDERVPKISHRMIFCSVPDRGLATLALAYPRIKHEIKDTSLVITSDYRLWGLEHPRNELHIKRFFGMDGVRFIGAIPRRELVKEQLLADVQAYPCNYDELFCYAVAECQVAGAYPVTSRIGALETTNMGTMVAGDSVNYQRWIEPFTNTLMEIMTNESLQEYQEHVRQKAIERFSLEKVMKKWEEVFSG